MMKRPIVGIVVAAVAVLATVAGCKSTTTASGSGPTAAPATSTTGAATTPAAAPTAASPTATAASAPAATSTGAAAGDAPNPCQLVPPADVKTVLGKSVAPSISTPAGVYHVCSYTQANLFIEVRNIDKASFDKSASLNPGGVTPVSGIGQDAYSSNGSPGGLLAWKDGTEIVLFIAGGGDHLAAEKQLATLAVARL